MSQVDVKIIINKRFYLANFIPFPIQSFEIRRFSHLNHIYLIPMPKEYIVVMQKTYPFGELGEVMTQNTQALVKKTLRYSNEEEKEMIGTMIHFIKAARNDSLINLEKILEGSGEVQLYYQYAPFRLERWIVTVNEELLVGLEEQVVQLAEHLTRMGIKYAFDPDCIGLCKDMRVKYFLNEFTIDFDGQEQHFEELKGDIRKFFKELASSSAPQEKEEVKESCRMESLSTNASISPLDQLITLTTQSLKKNEEKGSKNTQLSAKVENSMKKSLQALLRFKKMNAK